MGSRVLVGAYPCRYCGAPTKVRARAEIPFATCERCGQLSGRAFLGNFSHEEAARLAQAGTDEADTRLRAALFLEAASRAALASAEWLRALEFEKSPAGARRFWLAARNRAAWAQDVLAQLSGLLEDVADEHAPRHLNIVPPPQESP